MHRNEHKPLEYLSVVDAFIDSAGQNRDRTAVRCGEKSLTYHQLHLRSNALAAQLQAMGVKKGDLVGICSERRVELMVALLGILKTGAAYVPFDASYPESRLREMASDAGIQVLLGENRALGGSGFDQLSFDQFPKSKKFQSEDRIDGESVAYVMFTSGSTGKPKGVAVPHRAILRLVIDQDFCELGPEEVVLQHSPVAFDASTFEIWGPLLNGGQVVILPEAGTTLRTIGDAIKDHKITTMWLTAGLFHAMVDERPDDLRPLKQLLTGGDVVSPTHSLKILKECPDLKLINGYGPTENTTFTCCHPIKVEDVRDGGPIPVGKPISGTEVLILDEDLKPVKNGDQGELCASGEGLAIGYWEKPDLTAEKFVQLPDGTTLYRTGDLASRREDGTIDFLGRIDQQVKIRGFRIELGEIETAILELEGIQQVTVVADGTSDNTDKTLVAHYVGDSEISRDYFKSELEKVLPHHCIPAFYHRIDKLPLNPNGKVDRKALPSFADLLEFEAEVPEKKNTQSSLPEIRKAFSEVLEMPSIPMHINFFDLGASSIQIARVHERVQATLEIEFPITDFFRFTTIHSLSEYLDSNDQVEGKTDSFDTGGTSNDHIAIVGLAGRFPGAPDVDTFWENLIEGKETISHFSAEELDFENATANGADPNSTYVRSRGIVDQSEFFDARHFGIPPREAEELDPQHRLMLECAQTALENAGHDPDRFAGKIGIYCGSSQNSYLLNNLCADRSYSQLLAAGYPTTNFNALLGNDKDFLPTRVAYKLNLKGPAVSVQCACSTSLVSVAQACESLRSKTCDMALAGGISLGHPQKRDYLYTPDGIASKDGHCRTFDKQATGTVFGEGVGLVALRRLDDAIADGDQIVAVIRGFAVNNDGSDKAGYTAPSINGQIEVIRDAQKAAGIKADSIGYVEAHGTGTPLGDPIEVAALNAAFRESTDKKHFCTIGTGKTNVGHLDIAAGITGLIKTALTVQKGDIPPLLHFSEPNPKIDFENSAFVPATERKEWEPENGPRRAGVSAFGVGGTNVHMILEQSPIQQGTADDSTGCSTPSNRVRSSIFPISASHPDALKEAVANLGNFAGSNSGLEPDSIAYTLQYGRRIYDQRAVVVAKTTGELASNAASHSGKAVVAGNYSQVVFMFPGQGSQHPGMAEDLYASEPVFRKALDECAEIIQKKIGVNLLELMFPEEKDADAMADRLRNTSLAQPAIFSVEYALAQQWKHWGISPACMIGHSIGEFAAACIAGVFSLTDALNLICLRGKLMADLPGGAMTSVRASAEEIKQFLTDSVNLAAVNGKNSCVISGPFDDVSEVEKSLERANLEAKRLHTSHAFHSSMMESIVGEFEEQVSTLRLNAPDIPILSTVTRQWMTDAEARDPDYWATHLLKPVRFYDVIKQIWERSDHLLLEVGPGRTLATLAGQNPDRKNAQPSLASLPHPSKKESASDHMRQTLGSLWCHGFDIDWNRVGERDSKPGRIPLPTYPFQRKRFWIEPALPVADNPSMMQQWPNSFPSFPPNPNPVLNQPPSMTQTEAPTTAGVESALKEVLSELSGLDPSELGGSSSFLELGFDSLLLTQVGKEIQDTFKVKVSLRELIDEFSSLDQLTAHLEANTDPLAFAPQDAAPSVSDPAPQPQQQTAVHQMPPAGFPMMPFPQMPEMNQQMPMAYILMPYSPQMMAAVPRPQQPVPQAPQPQPEKVKAPDEKPKTVSGPTTVIKKTKSDEVLTRTQQSHLDQLIFRYTEKTKGSKQLTQKYRKAHADPRTASGFNREWKEMVYQIVTTKSKGSRLLDVDGNEYIDILNGFGPGFLGHSTDFLVDAVEKQLHEGYEVGPQSLLAMEAAELFCEVTGNERTSFVCTGSEAVQAAMRLARTVTKRDKIVIFARDYHGNFDEVLVRGVNGPGKLKSLPSAPGIPKASAGNMIVLPYGTDESLEIIRNMADELAAVIVEPVQSRRPEFQPRNFIREVREITSQSGALFVFDEVVTGFRFGPRGAQEFYGVEADLCTYGKVIGGGMPLGVVSGKSEYMDTFDGGMWQYGDDSFPDQPVTFFAGTFVRHPLAMASVKAMLEFFREQPLHFWNQVNAKGDRLAGTVNQFFQENEVPMEMPNCGSLMFVRMGEDQKYGNLFFYHLREKGIFMLEGFPSYMTAAHSDEDIDYTIDAFKESVFEMQSGGFFKTTETGNGFNGPTLVGPPPILSRSSETKRVDILPAKSVKKFLAPLTASTTEPQREILVASRLDERASCAFNESASLKFRGKLNVPALERAFATLVARHDALRATFSDDGLDMTVHPDLDIPIEKIDLNENGEDQLEAILHVDASTPYDLAKGPLVRPLLAKKSDEEYQFVISAHHLVCDGWSYNVISEELCELYKAECRGLPHNLPLPKQYLDHARETATTLQGDDHKAQEAFWLEEFSTIPDPIELPLDRPYLMERTFRGATLEHRIRKETYQAVKLAGAKKGSTLYSTLAAAFQLLIHRLTGQDDIVVCIPAAGQNDGNNTDYLIGHCVNFLPLRSRYDSGDQFDEFLSKSRKTLLAATDNRSFTYGELIQKLDIDRDPRRLPLLEVAFNVERMDYFGEWNDLDVVFEPNGKTHVHYTMFMNIVESDDGLRIDVDYNTDVLDRDTVETWVSYFETLLESIAGHPESCVARLPIMDDDQLSTVIHKWNQQDENGSFPESTVHELFEAIVESHSDSIALVSDEGQVTYGELDDQSNSVAVALRNTNVSPGDFVAVIANRSPEIVASLLGILKAGAAYVPIDPTYPEDRISGMLKDCAPAVLLVDQEIKLKSDRKVKTLTLKSALNTSVPKGFESYRGNSDDLAYTIYTSGSTGTPKGTLIPHRGIVRLVRNTNYMDFGTDQTFLLSAPISFDASTLELWGPLLNGGRLGLLPPGTPGLQDIGEAIQAHGVTTLWLTSGLFSLMVEEHPEALRGLQQLLAGGDVLSREHVARALKLMGEDGKLINGYGPTENTTFTTCHSVSNRDLKRNSIPIGKPISHTQCYILDEAMQPVPPGVKGRLYIGGDGLALGYLNQPELTLKKFVSPPFSDSSDERLYDSGDVCRWLKDGSIEFMGRADRQVKLRGFRIEPGEIENQLAGHPEINSTIVNVLGEGASDKNLVAYLVCDNPDTLDIDSVRRLAADSLPGYMVPSEFVALSELPVTANGKVDYRALPRPESFGNIKEDRESEAPATETQSILVALWTEVLGCGAVGIKDDFFKLGGHSLAGLKLFTRIHKELGVNLPLATLFQAPTVIQLSEIIDASNRSGDLQIITRVSKGSPEDVPLFLIHGGDGGTLFYKSFIEGIENYRSIYTVEAPMLVDRQLEKFGGSIEEIAQFYIEQIKSASSNERMAIGGYSFGGVIAYEVARQMRSEGFEIEKLFLFDTNNPANEDDYKNGISQWIRSGWEKVEGETFLSKVSKSGEQLGSKLQERTQLIQAKRAIREHQKNQLEMDDDLRMKFINDYHNEIMQQYVPGPYNGETCLFRAQASRFAFNREMGWEDVISNLIVCDISGPHQEIFDSPHVEVLIEKFNELFSLYA